MIDTDKYEGHTPAPWLATHDLVETEAKYSGKFTHVINHDGWRVWVGEKGTDVPHLQNNRFDSGHLDEADAKLIADAPLLLEEVKRLHQVIKKIKDCATINAQHDDTLNEEWEHILELIE